MALKCAVELGIPEAIHRHGQSMTLSQLTAKLSLPSAKSSCLARVMCMLVHAGFFTTKSPSDEGEEYDLTPLSEYLAKGGSDFVRGILQNPLTTSWLHLSSWFCEDLTASASPFHMVNGRSLYEYAGQNEEFNDSFNGAMTHFSRLVTSQMVEECGSVFTGIGAWIDGGGNGFTAGAIKDAFPHVKCIVLELPHIVATLKPSEKVEYVGGNMFRQPMQFFSSGFFTITPMKIV